MKILSVFLRLKMKFLSKFLEKQKLLVESSFRKYEIQILFKRSDKIDEIYFSSLWDRNILVKVYAYLYTVYIKHFIFFLNSVTFANIFTKTTVAICYGSSICLKNKNKDDCVSVTDS